MNEKRIGFGDNDEEECDGEGPQNVGGGCAEFVPHDDTADQLKGAAKFVTKMRKMGATYVKLGDVEVGFGVPQTESVSSGSSSEG